MIRLRRGRRSVPWLLAIATAVLLPEHARAQRLEVDLTGSRIRYDTLAALNAPSVSGLAEWQRSSMFARVTAGATGFEDAGWSFQGRGDLAGWLSPFGATSPFRLELGGTVGGARHSSGFDSWLTQLDARLHAGEGRWGGWTGVSIATAKSSYDSASIRGVVPNAGAWMQTGNARFTASYLHTVVSDASYPEANAAVTLTRGELDLTVYGGIRGSSIDGADLGERWAGASAAYWLTRNAALVVAGGKYSSDVLQALPGGDFLSIGLKLTPRRVRPIPIGATAPIVYTSEQARTGGIGFEVRGATSVEILGDWNAWTAQTLSRDASGRWLLPPGIPPGVYRFNLRVDGFRWMVPDGVPAVDDGFGGSVGILVVSDS